MSPQVRASVSAGWVLIASRPKTLLETGEPLAVSMDDMMALG